MSFQVWSYNPTRRQFTGTFTTADALPPGFYNIGVTQYGEPTAVQLDPRQDEMISFSTGPMPAVFEEMDRFWKSKLRYKTLGVTHKRGLLLHGPAGCGKSGIVNMAITDTVKRGGIAVAVNDLRGFKNGIPLLRQIENGRPILAIFEDMERMVKNGYEEMLLETMDGASTLGDGILFLATTNKLSELPPRIRCRPSRIDTLIEIGVPCKEQRKEYLKFLLTKIVPDEAEAYSLDWAKRTKGFSLAQLKELVISVTVYQKTLVESLDRVAGLGEKAEDEQQEEPPKEESYQYDASLDEEIDEPRRDTWIS